MSRYFWAVYKRTHKSGLNPEQNFQQKVHIYSPRKKKKNGSRVNEEAQRLQPREDCVMALVGVALLQRVMPHPTKKGASNDSTGLVLPCTSSSHLFLVFEPPLTVQMID